MTQIETVLKQISRNVVKEKTQQEEERKRGENFNIFNVLGLSTSEVRLHSAFLAELLNPNGDHGLGDKFLQAFINDVVLNNKESFSFDTNSAKINVEYPIGEVSQNYDRGGRIDLMIQDKNNQTIVIENKIYAGDQKLQLYRYSQYILEKLKLKDNQYCLLYLTLEGNKPTETSTGKHKFNYDCISYKEDILNWLNNCVGLAALFPKVRETIAQYITNINQIVNTNIFNMELDKIISDSLELEKKQSSKERYNTLNDFASKLSQITSRIEQIKDEIYLSILAENAKQWNRIYENDNDCFVKYNYENSVGFGIKFKCDEKDMHLFIGYDGQLYCQLEYDQSYSDDDERRIENCRLIPTIESLLRRSSWWCRWKYFDKFDFYDVYHCFERVADAIEKDLKLNENSDK